MSRFMDYGIALYLVAAIVMLFAGIAGCDPDSMFIKVLWFLSGFFFRTYQDKVIFPFLGKWYS